MIRYSLLFLAVSGLMLFAWRDWFKSLCLLVVMVSILERPDMPKTMLGVQGLNPFNIALTGIVLAWAVIGERRTWKVPKGFLVLLVLFTAVMFVSFVRMFLDPGPLLSRGFGPGDGAYTRVGLVAEYFLNTFKWMVPGLLLGLGCNSKGRHRWVVFCLALLYVVLAIQTIRQMPLGYLLDGEALEERAARVLRIRVGYHRVELAGLFAGASWAIAAMMPLYESRLTRLALLAASGITLLGLALTGGRTGYATWVVLGLGLASLRWWRVLLVGPVVLASILYLAPGVSERFLQGFSVDEGGESRSGAETDVYTVTAGRSVVWPFVLRGISTRPFLGYGREAFDRSGLRTEVFRASGEDFGHPHNGYFQFALDNGIPGLAIALALYLSLAYHGARLFRSPDPRCSAAGGMALSLVGALLIAAVGAQTFYPTEASLGLWCAVGVMVRMSGRQSESRSAPEPRREPHSVRQEIAKTPRWSPLAPSGGPSGTFAPLRASIHQRHSR